MDQSHTSLHILLCPCTRDLVPLLVYVQVSLGFAAQQPKNFALLIPKRIVAAPDMGCREAQKRPRFCRVDMLHTSLCQGNHVEWSCARKEYRAPKGQRLTRFLSSKLKQIGRYKTGALRECNCTVKGAFLFDVGRELRNS